MVVGRAADDGNGWLVVWARAGVRQLMIETIISKIRPYRSRRISRYLPWSLAWMKAWRLDLNALKLTRIVR
jgi:hypothetical protein